MTTAFKNTCTPAARRRTVHVGLAAVCAAAALALAGCGGKPRVYEVFVQDDIPTPLIDPLPLTAVVHYTPEFASFSSSQESLRGEPWVVDFADMHQKYFHKVLESMFDEVVVVTEPSAAGIEHDVMLVPRVDNFAFLTPAESGTRFFAASLRHMVQIYGPDGTDFGAWEINSYGRSRSSFGALVYVLAEEACRDAMRDFAASLAVGLPEEISGRNVVPAAPGDGA